MKRKKTDGLAARLLTRLILGCYSFALYLALPLYVLFGLLLSFGSLFQSAMRRAAAPQPWFVRLGLGRRLHKLPKDALWLHAVSVGEIAATFIMLPHLRSILGGRKIIISCSTAGGFAMAQKRLRELVMQDERGLVGMLGSQGTRGDAESCGNHGVRGKIEEGKLFWQGKAMQAGQARCKTKSFADEVFLLYAPLDIGLVVRRFFRILRPCALAVAEMEIWPNLFACAAVGREGRGIPIVMYNARMPDKEWRRYARFKTLFAHVLAPVRLIIAQSAEDASRYCDIGAAIDRI